MEVIQLGDVFVIMSFQSRIVRDQLVYLLLGELQRDVLDFLTALQGAGSRSGITSHHNAISKHALSTLSSAERRRVASECSHGGVSITRMDGEVEYPSRAGMDLQ